MHLLHCSQVLKHHSDEVHREDGGEIHLQKPRQFFWEKRLTGLSPTFEDDDFRPPAIGNVSNNDDRMIKSTRKVRQRNFLRGYSQK
jgi:hypothetical protein